MIKVSELRVRNIVLYKQDNDELPVLKIDGDKKTVCLDLLLGLNMELNEQDIDPIPLTPEWLERCGFINKGNVTKVGYTNEWEGPDYFTIWQLNGHPHSYEYFGSEWTHGKSFEFVHQLQNLYFALTGKELQIKMP